MQLRNCECILLLQVKIHKLFYGNKDERKGKWDCFYNLEKIHLKVTEMAVSLPLPKMNVNNYCC